MRALDVIEKWTEGERILVATRLLAVVQEDLSSGRYGAPGRPTVPDAVSVLNAPAEVLDERRGFYSAVMRAEKVAAEVSARERSEAEADAVMSRTTHRKT